MKKLTLTTRLILFLVMIEVVIISMILLLNGNSQELLSRTDWILHTQTVLTKVANIEKRIVDLETGQRGFLITGKESYLEPFQEGRIYITTELDDLEELTSDNESQTERIRKLRILLKEKIDELDQTIELRRTLGYDAAKELVMTDLGKNLMVEMRTLTSEMIAEEQKLMQTRIQKPQEAIDDTNRSLYFVIAINILIVAGVSYVFIRLVIFPLKTLRSGTEEVAKGNLNHRFQVTTQDEMGQLADSFNTMLEELQSQLISIDRLQTEIHAKEKAESMLSKVNSKLNNAVAQLQLNEERLKQSNEELEQFAYVASHDLKEPLRMLSSYSQLLAKKYQAQLGDKGKKYISYILEGAERMQKLIDVILIYSRVSSSSTEMEKVDLNQVVDEVLGDLNKRIKDSKAHIEIDTLPQVEGERTQLIRVFTNLIENGIKYIAPGSHPHISVGVEKEKEYWLFSVKDNGIGFDPEFIEKAFRMFTRQHSREKYEGTGVGLAIVKRIIQKHNGDIRIKSPIDNHKKGSIVYFTLPNQHS